MWLWRDRQRALTRAAAQLAVMYLLACCATASASTPLPDWRQLSWTPIASIVNAQIATGRLPGAVVVIGDADGIVYRGAFGARAVKPERQPMTPETIFDVASLTKVLATTTAILQLAEQRRIDLDAHVAIYWPEFATHGKGAITVRQLLAHTSGLRPDLDLDTGWSGRKEARRRILAERPVSPPGSAVLYSDINFLVLGELVERISRERLDRYCERHIFAPLRMRNTRFRPPASTLSDLALTTAGTDGTFARGVVHDPTARRLGGLAGHAGLFSTAEDLARFARMLLGGGALDGKRVLGRRTVAELPVPASGLAKLVAGGRWRGLGWALDAPLVAGRTALPPVGLLGHTGYTGTGLWVDTVTRRFVIILSNRVHAGGGGDAAPLRSQILALVAHAHGPMAAAATSGLVARQRELAPLSATKPTVQTGIDVLAAQQFAPLAGLRVGVVTNLSALDARGARTVDVLRQAPGVHVAAIFAPEHGFDADGEGRIASGVEAMSGLPVHSLYGETRKPVPASLAGLDALVFDMQDAGARFYTYISTLGLVLEAAAEAQLPVYVLDRPNPVGADLVDGPMLDADLTSFTAWLPMPVQHGMTVGEIARLIVAEKALDVDVHVIRMQGYRRDMRFPDTGLTWQPPSPNLRSPKQALLYPGVAMVEGANVSVGRGTERPFEQLGAPWIDAQALVRVLRASRIDGVRITAVHFTPDAGPYTGQRCHGVAFSDVDAKRLRPSVLGIAITSALQALHADHFKLASTLGMVGSRDVLESIRRGTDVKQIVAAWEPDLHAFRQRREAHLLY